MSKKEPEIQVRISNEIIYIPIAPNPAIQRRVLRYQKMRPDRLDKTLQGLIRSGHRLMAKYRGQVGAYHKSFYKYQRIQKRSFPNRTQEEHEKNYEKGFGSVYSHRISVAMKRRIENAEEKAIIRYVLKEKNKNKVIS